MVIDFHTHCFVNSLAPAAIATLEKNAKIKALHDGTLAGLTAFMAECGVDRFVVQPVATKPSQVPVINEWAKNNGNEKAVFFGALHPDDPDFLAAAQKLKADGIKGVKFHPDYQNFYADDEKMMPLYEAMRDLGLIAMLHAGWDIGLPAPIRCTPLMISRVIKNVPGLKLVAAHMGGHALWRDVEETLLGLPLYIDTSYSHYVLQDEGMVRMIKKHGADRVLFGSDSPWKRADDDVRTIMGFDLPLEDKEAILYKNAAALLS